MVGSEISEHNHLPILPALSPPPPLRGIFPMRIHRNVHDITTDLDISSLEFWELPFDEREKTFRQLRANYPVSWHRPMESPNVTPEEHGETGFWAIARAEDITYASHHHELFSSELGHTVLGPGKEGDSLDLSFLELDPPRHTEFRKVMSAAFTPKAVARLSGKIEERAAAIIDRVVGAGAIDFVTEVSAKLPMMTVADMIGVPESSMEDFAAAGDMVVQLGDPRECPDPDERIALGYGALGTISEIASDLADARRAQPEDDIMTALVNAKIDGEPLEEEDILMLMLLLSVAGNDTTKQTTTRTLIQLDRNPDQREWLMEDFDGRITGAIEEFVRHASPVIEFARTATQDTELGGQQIQAGDKMGLFYCSGNRDERVFENPDTFDLSRKPNPHVGFGGGGVHYCLGNGVAKAQLRALYWQILTKLPNIEVGEPDYLASNFINGVKHLPVVIH